MHRRQNLFASELVIRAERSEIEIQEGPIELEEQRSPPIHLVNRVPGVLKGLGRLVYAIRVEGDGPGKHRVKK